MRSDLAEVGPAAIYFIISFSVITNKPQIGYFFPLNYALQTIYFYDQDLKLVCFQLCIYALLMIIF